VRCGWHGKSEALTLHVGCNNRRFIIKEYFDVYFLRYVCAILWSDHFGAHYDR
jgi:hypothetical protein